MSIVDLIKALEAHGKLARYVPDGKRKARRRLFLSENALKTYNDKDSAVNLLTGRGHIKSAFDRWTLGERIHGDWRRGKLIKGRFLCPLHPPPDNIWEIRVTEPINQARLLGFFIEIDTLLVTSLNTRRVLDEDGGWSSKMTEAQTTWTSLFPLTQPFIAKTINEYISENCDEFPITARPPSKRRTG